MQLTFTYTGWSFIHRIHDLKNGGLCVPGDPATYGCTVPGSPHIYRLALPVGKGKNGNWLVTRGDDLSMIYPDRVFVYARDDKNEGITDRQVILDVFKEAGIRGDGFWEPVEIQRGWKNGFLWDTALRSNTEFGPAWHDVRKSMHALAGKWQIDTWASGVIPSFTAWRADNPGDEPPPVAGPIKGRMVNKPAKIRRKK